MKQQSANYGRLRECGLAHEMHGCSFLKAFHIYLDILKPFHFQVQVSLKVFVKAHNSFQDSQ